MSQAVYLASLLAALLLGVTATRPLRRVPQATIRGITTGVLYLLIFTMGMRIGRTEEISRHFSTIGLRALLYALAGVGGTVVVLLPLFRATAGRGETGSDKRDRAASEQPAPSAARALGRGRGATRGSAARKAEGTGGSGGGGNNRRRLRGLADPLRLLTVLLAGGLAGRFLPLSPALRPEAAISWILYLLLFLIGITLARSGLRLRHLLDHSLWVLPLGTALGTLLAGGGAALVLGERLGSGLAVASGFGWYSLSGVLLIELDGPVLGATAFLANMFREALALVVIPLLARTRYPYLAIGAAGATSMDVTLPLIESTCGPRAVPLAVASGAVLSTAVPVLLPLLYAVG